jgi:hypothetical protein
MQRLGTQKFAINDQVDARGKSDEILEDHGMRRDYDFDPTRSRLEVHADTRCGVDHETHGRAVDAAQRCLGQAVGANGAPAEGFQVQRAPDVEDGMVSGVTMHVGSIVDR